MYLFKGDQVIRYDVRNETVLHGGPWDISVAFPDLKDTTFDSGLSAACLVPGLVGAFTVFCVFKGDRYMRVRKQSFQPGPATAHPPLAQDLTV
ncbi:hemopexin repeat-containing protein [Nonomuraea sp. NPDC003727]